MPLDKATLKVKIKQAFKDQATKETNPDAALDDLATKLAGAIDEYIKQGDVVVDFPIAVTVAPSTGTGGTTAPGKGSIM